MALARRPSPGFLGLLLAAGLAATGATCSGKGAEGPAEGRQAPPAAGAETPGPEPSRPAGGPERLTARVMAEYPHDPEAFTQGLLVHDGLLYESTGRYGRSELRRVDPRTGEVLLRRELPGHLFGEGLTLVPGGPGGTGDRLVQLTWQEGVALVWDRESLRAEGELRYQGEGWGLAWDGERLVMSDGSAWLSFREPHGFSELARVEVTLEGRPLPRINELEWVDDALWANVLGSDSVVRIDPATGEVTAVADLAGIEARLPRGEAGGIDVLNGIAWWPERGSFLVTGKLWPRLFEVVFE